MSELKYDFQNNLFTVWEPSNEAEKSKLIFTNPLGDSYDISDFATEIKDNEVPIVKDNLQGSQFVFNSPEYIPQSKVQEQLGQHSQQPQVPSQPPQQKLITSNPEVKLAGYTGNINHNKVEAFNYLVSKGIPRGSAAGIVGNLYYENLANPMATVRDSNNTYAYGIAGFNNKGELPNLLKWSNSKGYGNKPNFYQQLDYLIESIKNRNDLKELLNENLSPNQASFIWGKNFERFRGSTNNGRGYLNINDPEHKKRAKLAVNIFNNK